jgi:uncharacterized membrane protein YphA (DoxX/SURF4 family)
MNLFDTLASHGLTTTVLQVLIVGGIALVVIGMFWKVIVAGAAIAFCVAVFAMPSGSVSASDTGKKEFMQDCMHYEGDKVECEKIWKERE